MADSSIDDELFADNNDIPNPMGLGNGEGWDQNGGQSSRIHLDPPPQYTEMSEFSEFVQDNQVHVDSRYGYACVFLYRPFYFPGQTVRGFALLDAFNDIPAKEVMIRVKGREIPGKHGNKITKKLIKAPEVFHMES
jgi:hypothetical protein